MFVDVKVPMLAESVPDATLLEWQKQPGEPVEVGDLLIELETDKVVLEVVAPASGVLSEILKQTGETALSDEVIARIDTEGKAEAAPAQPPPEAEPERESPEPRAQAPAQSGAAPAPPAPATPSAAAAARLSPAVQRLVDEHGLDPARIAGSGPGGRITKGDVLAHLESAPAPPAPDARPAAVQPAPIAPAPPAATPVAEAPPGERREPMSRLRQRIGERLLDAQRNAAILTTFNEVDMTPVSELRRRYRDAFEKTHGVRLGFMSFFAQAAVRALQRFPAVNAYIEGSDIVYHDYCDIGIAVGSPRGLVVPILRNVESMTFAEIEKRIAEFGERAGRGQLTIEEMSGGTFTISNGGVFGSLLSTPILNPPQSAILGMHKTEQRPVVVDGAIVIRPMMYLALSYDHRIVDGREAVLFLVTIKEALEDPARMLLDL